MTSAQRSFRKPGSFGVFKDFVNRAIQRELHLPPWWLRDVGGSDFLATGQEFLQYFRQLVNLQPDERVLDIGCGSGRMAIPLTSYLSQEGAYAGVDITADSILWCQQHITHRYPNFQFFYADLYNQRYNPGGRHQARDYSFPFDDNGFDFVFLSSVFTHLLPDDTANYLHEIARLLRSQGRALITFFLLNETQQILTNQGRSEIEFRYGSGTCRFRDEAVPESAVAYEETFLRSLLSQCDLEITEPVYYGRWSGRENGLSYQDILVIQPVGAQR